MESLGGSTPLGDDEAEELVPTHLTTRDQLDAWEQANIVLAVAWLSSRRGGTRILAKATLRELHRRMFDRTWEWAGRFRTTEKNIGVAPHEIAPKLHDLLQDTQFWIEHRTYEPDEIAARFHHRLVAIHPFPNGNGRHARLATDALLASLGIPPFTWGAGDLTSASTVRRRYLHALQLADRDDYSELLHFVRS